MIWTESNQGAEEVGALESYLRDEIRKARPSAADVADEVARGVAAFWRERLERRVLPSDYVAALIASALRGVGETEAADRVTGSADRLGWVRPPSLSLWRCLASGVCRSSVWAGDEPLWILDLSRLAGLSADILELVWFPALRVLLTGAAELWEETQGRGTLALRVPSPAELGDRARRRWRNDLVRFSEVVLGRLGSQRGWTDVPHLLLLEGRQAARPAPA